MKQKLSNVAGRTLHANELHRVLEGRAGEIALIRKLPLLLSFVTRSYSACFLPT